MLGTKWPLSDQLGPPNLAFNCDSPHTGSEDSEENRGPELQQEPQGQKAHPEADSSEDSTDPKEAVSGLAPPPSSPSLRLGPCGFPVNKGETQVCAGAHSGG